MNFNKVQHSLTIFFPLPSILIRISRQPSSSNFSQKLSSGDNSKTSYSLSTRLVMRPALKFQRYHDVFAESSIFKTSRNSYREPKGTNGSRNSAKSTRPSYIHSRVRRPPYFLKRCSRISMATWIIRITGVESGKG